MTKPKKVFYCSECGFQTSRWLGVCPKCDEADTFEEQETEATRAGRSQNTSPPADLIDVSKVNVQNITRTESGIKELDRVLGGGLVPGSGIVLAGEPGAGKSTLAGEAVIKMAQQGASVGYFSGEESKAQVKMRLDRLGLKSGDQVGLSDELSVERICNAIKQHQFDFIVIDSIQTVFSEEVPGAPGSVSQIKESAHQIMRTAKTLDTAVLIIGQVVKSGEMAGPRTLEHLVDVVLNFEGDRREQYRILRAHKNRFGNTDEVGVFEMTGTGLKGVEDISSLFIEDNQGMPGSCPTIVIEGSRPVICEIQALASPSDLANPIRAVNGINPKRVQMLLAVLTSRAGLPGVGSKDIYVSVAGSLKIDDPSADFAIAIAIASAISGKAVDHESVAFGEISLLGLVKPAMQQERRIKEATRLNYKSTCVKEVVNIRTALQQLGLVGQGV